MKREQILNLLTNEGIEVWRTAKINGVKYEDYMVSNLGRVKSLKYGKERILDTTKKTDGGYLRTRFNGKKYMVHRVVLESFFREFAYKEQVNHLDGDKTNNKITNLEYCYQCKNMCHAVRTGLRDEVNRKSAERMKRPYIDLKTCIAYDSLEELCNDIGLHRSTINKYRVKEVRWAYLKKIITEIEVLKADE